MSDCDLIVVGAGIFGLWQARHAIKAGKRAIVCEKRKVAAGASGGFLGALMPHMPDVWNAKKQMQFEALLSLEAAIAELEADTGLSCGYRRCGRIMPLPHEKMLKHMEARSKGANAHWVGDDQTPLFSMRHLAVEDFDPNFAGWINPELAKFGISHDTFSARVDPRAYLAALAHYTSAHATLHEGADVIGIDPGANTVQLADGSKLAGEEICIASGHEAYRLLQPYLGPLNAGQSIGRGVKGQAVLLDYHHDDDLPIVYHNGVYVVPQEGNRVAVGSTSENDWFGEPDAFDPDNMGFYHAAMELVPVLKEAPIVERWAGVRPRNTLGPPWEHSAGTEPYIGTVSGFDGLRVAIGGFKISFGIAHLAAP